MDDGPKRVKIDSVCDTHESGDNEMRQSVRNTRMPYRRPVRYQIVSEMSAAITATASNAVVACAVPVRYAPAMMSVG
jgi:hypothetical protein